MANDTIIDDIYRVLEARKAADPADSYVASLYAGGADKILKKIGEECSELLISGKGGSKNEIVHETADLWFHSLVFLAYSGVDVEMVLAELKSRFGQSGLEEKASRQRQ